MNGELFNLPLPRKAEKQSDAGKAPGQRPALNTLPAPGGEERPEIRRPQIRDILQRRRPAEMTGQETEELSPVALVGAQRLVGQAAFVGKVIEPEPDPVIEIRFRCDQKVGRVWGARAHRPILAPVVF